MCEHNTDSASNSKRFHKQNNKNVDISTSGSINRQTLYVIPLNDVEDSFDTSKVDRPRLMSNHSRHTITSSISIDNSAIDDWPITRTLLFTLIGTILYVVDVGTDVYVAYTYLRDGDRWWGSLTLTFIILPGLVNSTVCIVYAWNRGTTWHRACAIGLSMLLIGPLYSFLRTLFYGCRLIKKPKKKEKAAYRDEVKNSNAISIAFTLIESALESGPQLVLQLYIIAADVKTPATMQIVSCVASLLFLAWVPTSFECVRQRDEKDTADMSTLGALSVFAYRVNLTASRVLALAMFASVYRAWVVFAMLLHVVVIMVMMRISNPIKKCGDYLGYAFLSFIYVLIYIRLENIYVNYLFYYLFCFAENVLFVLLAWFLGKPNHSAFHFPVMIIVFASLCVGAVILFIYNCFFQMKNFNPSTRVSRSVRSVSQYNNTKLSV